MVARQAQAARGKVLVCSNNSAGILLFRLEVLQLLQRQGWQPCLLLPFDSAEQRRALEQLGYVCIPLPFHRRSLNPLGLVWLLLRYLYYIVKLRPQLVLSYTIKPCLCASLVARLLGRPYAAVITGLGYSFSDDSRISSLVSWAYRLALRRAEAVFLLNSGNLDFFRRERLAPTERCHLLAGEGVDLQKYAECPLVHNSPPVFLLVARLLRQKGIAEFAQASSILQQQGLRCRCQLLGPQDEGADRVDPQELSAWVAAGWVEYLGATDAGAYEYLCAADCVVLPSYHEGMSRVLMEAAAVGRPIITTDAAGCRELVEVGANGWLCPSRDPAALARAMAEFLQLSKQQRARMGTNSRAKLIADGFDAHQVAASIYNRLPSLQ